MEDRFDRGVVLGFDIDGWLLSEKVGPDTRFAIFGEFPAGDDLVKVRVAGEEYHKAVRDELGESGNAGAEFVDYAG